MIEAPALDINDRTYHQEKDDRPTEYARQVEAIEEIYIIQPRGGLGSPDAPIHRGEFEGEISNPRPLLARYESPDYFTIGEADKKTYDSTSGLIEIKKGDQTLYQRYRAPEVNEFYA
jgi:hypothetical protein